MKGLLSRDTGGGFPGNKFTYISHSELLNLEPWTSRASTEGSSRSVNPIKPYANVHTYVRFLWGDGPQLSSDSQIVKEK